MGTIIQMNDPYFDYYNTNCAGTLIIKYRQTETTDTVL